MVTRRTPGQRAGLSHAGVVRAAREVLSERGVEGLTMRALADRLGVVPNALYSHVESKRALIDDVLDDVLAGIDPPSVDVADPLVGLRRLMRTTLEVLSNHPGLVPLYVTRHGARGPHAQRLGDVMLRLLERAGVRGSEAGEAQRVLIVYTIGFAAFGTRLPFEAERPVPQDELAESFDQGLRWLLAGIVGGRG